MRLVILLTSTFLSFAAIDLNVLRRRRDSGLSSTPLSLAPLGGERLEHKKQIRRFDVIPQEYREPEPYVRSKCNYFCTQARDVRYSDQRKIRRRINNL